MITLVEILTGVDNWLKERKQSPLTPHEILYLVTEVVEIINDGQIETPQGLSRQINLCIAMGVSKIRHYPIPSYMV